MAKDPDNLAADFDTESSTGLLAEEHESGRSMLWRLGSWGFAAVGAVTVAVMANQSSLTLKRDQVAAVDVARQAQQLQTLAKESHNETRRLASAIDTLNSDRDRLYSRVSTLEQGLDSVTGAIAKQPPATAALVGPAAPPAPVQPPAAAPAVAAVATTQPAPPDKPATSDKPAAPAEKPATLTEKPAATADKKSIAAIKPQPASDAKPQATSDTKPQVTDKPQAVSDKPPAAVPENSSAAAVTAPVVAASPAAAAAPVGADGGKPSTPTPPAMLTADNSMIGPPAPVAGKPLEPIKQPTTNNVTSSPMPEVATATPADDAEEDDSGAPKAQIQRTEFGVDLGTANSVNGLRALWRGLLKAKANAPLAALRPIIVIKENINGLGMQLRLVAGPLNDAGTAAKICAGLSLPQRTCETAIYDGQRLALKPDDGPAAGKPVQPQRRFVPKRAVAAPPVAEEKKPEPTTFSSMFRRNGQ